MSARIFEPIEELELFDGDRLVGVYLPGWQYNCRDDVNHAGLSKVLDQWIAEGRARIVEQSAGTQPVSIVGQGEVQ